MRDFVAQRHNVLLCSTIIETGIDVPSANTILINRADRFGLAQLHQLRGRVGRSHHQAYAYLLVPDVEGLSKAAAQRLEAIQQMEELGSGFYLAMHDLEIRGAGEVLGDNQSGNMGGMIAGSLLAGVAGAFIGTAIAGAMFDDAGAGEDVAAAEDPPAEDPGFDDGGMDMGGDFDF